METCYFSLQISWQMLIVLPPDLQFGSNTQLYKTGVGEGISVGVTSVGVPVGSPSGPGPGEEHEWQL